MSEPQSPRPTGWTSAAQPDTTLREDSTMIANATPAYWESLTDRRRPKRVRTRREIRRGRYAETGR